MRARARGLFAGMLPAAVAMAAIVPGAPPAGAAASPGIISTQAGGSGRGLVHNVAQEANGVATAPDGSVYVSDVQGVVRQFNDTSTWEKAIAGVGVVTGYGGDGGKATRARLGLLGGLALDQHQNVIVADNGNNRIRMIAAVSGTYYGVPMTAGDIYTVAGDGSFGFAGDGGPATSAELGGPESVTVDGAGNLVISDSGNELIRVVAATSGTFYGQAMTAGHIYTVAGNGSFGFSGDGGPATSATLADPQGVTVDGAGNLIIADSSNNRIRVVAAKTGTFYGVPMTAGDIYTVAGTGSPGFSGDGGPATAANLGFPSSVAVDHYGNLVISLPSTGRVRVVAARTGIFYDQAMIAGDIYTVAGNGLLFESGNTGKPRNAELSSPSAIAVDGPGSGAGNYAVLDYGEVRLVPATSGTFFGQVMSAGRIYGIAGNGRPGYMGDGGPATSARVAPPPGGVSFDRSGNLLLADAGNNRIRVVAAGSGSFYGQAMTMAHIYTVAGDGTAGFGGDEGPASAAELNGPEAVTVDAHGNLVIADTGNNRIRVVAATSGTFYGVAMTAGHIYTVAGTGTPGFSGDGGPAAAAMLQAPASVVTDKAGNLVIADSANNRIRVVAATSGTFYGVAMTAGHIYTVAGTGSFGFTGDGGPAASAELDDPLGVSVDGSGNLLIADTGNERVRLVAAAAGTYYGQAVAAGDIATVAGNGLTGFYGEDRPATSAQLDDPQATAVRGSGNLLIADTGNGRVREVSGSASTLNG
jgi:trimeric autotransporter adhesin